MEEEDEEDDCAVCIEPLSAAAIVTLSCSHRFHKACIEVLVQRGGHRCPTCRRSCLGNRACKGFLSTVMSVCALPDGRVAGGAGERELLVWNLEASPPASVVWEGHTGAIKALCTLTDGRVASGSMDGTVRVWCTTDGTSKVAFSDGRGNRLDLCALPEGRLAIASRDRVFEWSDARTTLLFESPDLNAVCADATGQIVTGHADGTVRKGGETVLTRHDAAVTTVCVLADGRVASGDERGVVRVSGNGAELVCVGHTARVRSVCALADGRVVSGGDDNVLRVWTDTDWVEGGKHAWGIRAVCAMPDGRVASGGGDEFVRVWHL